MTLERFHALTEAYGADFKRWPAAERDAAQRLLAEGAPEAVSALTRAAQLDGMLAQHKVAPPSAALVSRIEASAPSLQERRQEENRQIRPPQGGWFWLSGAGLASAGLAGALAGALFVAHFSPVMMSSVLSDFSYSATVFGDIDGQDE